MSFEKYMAEANTEFDYSKEMGFAGKDGKDYQFGEEEKAVSDILNLIISRKETAEEFKRMEDNKDVAPAVKENYSKVWETQTNRITALTADDFARVESFFEKAPSNFTTSVQFQNLYTAFLAAKNLNVVKKAEAYADSKDRIETRRRVMTAAGEKIKTTVDDIRNNHPDVDLGKFKQEVAATNNDIKDFGSAIDGKQKILSEKEEEAEQLKADVRIIKERLQNNTLAEEDLTYLKGFKETGERVEFAENAYWKYKKTKEKNDKQIANESQVILKYEKEREKVKGLSDKVKDAEKLVDDAVLNSDELKFAIQYRNEIAELTNLLNVADGQLSAENAKKISAKIGQDIKSLSKEEIQAKLVEKIGKVSGDMQTKFAAVNSNLMGIWTDADKKLSDATATYNAAAEKLAEGEAAYKAAKDNCEKLNDEIKKEKEKAEKSMTDIFPKEEIAKIIEADTAYANGSFEEKKGEIARESKNALKEVIKSYKNEVVRLNKEIEAKNNEINAVKDDINAENEKLSIAQAKHSEHKDIAKQLKGLKDTYKTFREAASNKETVETAAYNPENDIKALAQNLFDKKELKKGIHINSNEYNRMIEAIEIVTKWGTEEGKAIVSKMKNPPVDFEAAVENMREQSVKYQQAKEAQNRPNPSEMRLFRLTVAKAAEELAEKSIKAIEYEKFGDKIALDTKAEKGENEYTVEHIDVLKEIEKDEDMAL